MLNRIYILTGLSAIILLVGAFVAPLFVDWNSYRDRMEIIAQKIFGKQVEINGDMSLTLLPQPKLKIENIKIGDDGETSTKIALISAKFSLLDFLRDRYNITNLTLYSPQIFLKIDKKGEFIPPIILPDNIEQSNLSIDDANIENGAIYLFDKRVGETIGFDNFFGNLSLKTLRGPFSLKGRGEFLSEKYNININSTSLNSENKMQMAIYLQPQNKNFTLKINGTLLANIKPQFSGEIDFRLHRAQEEENSENKNLGVRGDLVLTSDISISNEEILLKQYFITPDENLPATRLSGAANIDLDKQKFNAVISGGFLSLAFHKLPNNSKSEFALIDFLNNVKAPFIPPIKGQIGVDLAEIDLGFTSLRNIRLDVRSDGEKWLIDNFQANLAGKSELAIKGILAKQDKKAIFSGDLSLKGEQFHLLAKEWRRIEGEELFNIPFSLSAKIELENEQFSIKNAQFNFDNIKNQFALNFPLSKKPNLSFKANLGEFSKKQGQNLLNLLPQMGANTKLNNSFSAIDFIISAKKFSLFDIVLKNIKSKGKLARDRLNLLQFFAIDLASAKLNFSGEVSINKTNPKLWGEGGFEQTQLSDKKEGVISNIFERLNLPPKYGEIYANSLPLKLDFKLNETGEQNRQILNIVAQAKSGEGEFDFVLEMENGIFEILSAPIKAKLNAKFASSLTISDLLGFSDIELFSSGGQTTLNSRFEGAIMNSLQSNIDISTNKGESAKFGGNLIVSDISNWRGNGSLMLGVDDISPFIEILGVGGVSAAKFAGEADISFNGANNIKISNINAKLNNSLLGGELNKQKIGNDINISGELKSEAIRLASLAKLLGGSTSTIGGDIWPDGPFSLVQNNNVSRVKIDVFSDLILLKNAPIAKEASFEYLLDKENIFLREFLAKINDKDIYLDLSICCASSNSSKQINGLAKFENIAINKFLPNKGRQNLSGEIAGTIQFNGDGNSYFEIIKNLAGEGSIIVENLKIDGFNDRFFSELKFDENIEDQTREKLVQNIFDTLYKNEFFAQKVNIPLIINRGNLRANNININTDISQIFGNIKLSLADFSLEGNWEFTPKEIANNKILDKTNAFVLLKLAGNLFAPQINIDISAMVEGVMVKALEMELDSLEKLRQEAEQRSKEAALRRFELIQEQKRIREEKERKELQKHAIEEAKRLARQLLKAPNNSLNIEIYEAMAGTPSPPPQSPLPQPLQLVPVQPDEPEPIDLLNQ